MAEYENALAAGNPYKKIPGTLWYTKQANWQDSLAQAEKERRDAIDEELNALKKQNREAEQAERKKWREIKKQVSPQVGGPVLNALRFGKDFMVGLGEYLVGTDGKLNYESMEDRFKHAPYYGEKGSDGRMHLHIDTIPDLISKWWFHEDDENIPMLESLKALEDENGGGKAGEKDSTSVGVGIGPMPTLQMPDYAALRKKLNELDIDTQYEAPQKNPLVMIGQALANIDLTSNLAGDWSKAAQIAADYQQYNEEQAKSAKNKNADKKAEIAMWKALKDISLQEAEADAAMKQAEFGLRWQQLKNQAALQQAKANAYYSGYGFGISKADAAKMRAEQHAINVGRWAALQEYGNKKSIDLKKALSKAGMINMQNKIPDNVRAAFQDSFLQTVSDLAMQKSGGK